MKLKIIIPLLVLLLIIFVVIFIFHFRISLSTNETFVPNETIGLESFVEGKKILFEIKKDQLMKTPEILSTMKLPISIDSAIKIASKEFITYVSDTSKWYLKSIKIERVYFKSNIWYYEIFYTKQIMDLKEYQYINIPVLMDGSVIKAKISK